MDEFEKFKKSIICGKCLEEYVNGSSRYSCKDCCLHMCSTCYNSKRSQTLCRCGCGYEQSYVRKVENTKVLLAYIDRTSKVNAASKLEIEKLKTENSKLKEKQKKMEQSREDHHKCIECTTSESEQKMQLCSSCHEIDLNKLEENVLCSSCAIKKHIRKGHQAVDFYPYLRAFNFNSHSAEFTSESENLKTSRDFFNTTVKKFNDLSKNASENFNVLTDMARRSNCTKNQVDFFEKIKAFVKESKLVHVNADNDLKKHTDTLEKNLVNIKKWYEERVGNCVDDWETIENI